jgi:hypothetical protein
MQRFSELRVPSPVQVPQCLSRHPWFVLGSEQPAGERVEIGWMLSQPRFMTSDCRIHRADLQFKISNIRGRQPEVMISRPCTSVEVEGLRRFAGVMSYPGKAVERQWMFGVDAKNRFEQGTSFSTSFCSPHQGHTELEPDFRAVRELPERLLCCKPGIVDAAQHAIDANEVEMNVQSPWHQTGGASKVVGSLSDLTVPFEHLGVHVVCVAIVGTSA